MKGWVYIAVNESLPGQVKIGFSDRHPEQRMQELYNTSIPTPFRCAYAGLVDYPNKIEQEIHRRLESVRISPAREFFTLDIASAIAEFDRTVKDLEQAIYYTEIDDSLVTVHPKETLTPESTIELKPSEANRIKSILKEAIARASKKIAKVRQLAEESGNWVLVEHMKQRQDEFKAWTNSYIAACDLSSIARRLNGIDDYENSARLIAEFIEREAQREIRWLGNLRHVSARFDESVD